MKTLLNLIILGIVGWFIIFMNLFLVMSSLFKERLVLAMIYSPVIAIIVVPVIWIVYYLIVKVIEKAGYKVSSETIMKAILCIYVIIISTMTIPYMNRYSVFRELIYSENLENLKIINQEGAYGKHGLWVIHIRMSQKDQEKMLENKKIIQQKTLEKFQVENIKNLGIGINTGDIEKIYKFKSIKKGWNVFFLKKQKSDEAWLYVSR